MKFGCRGCKLYDPGQIYGNHQRGMCAHAGWCDCNANSFWPWFWFTKHCHGQEFVRVCACANARAVLCKVNHWLKQTKYDHLALHSANNIPTHIAHILMCEARSRVLECLFPEAVCWSHWLWEMWWTISEGGTGRKPQLRAPTEAFP